MAASKASKLLFKSGIIPVYRETGVANCHLDQWIKLSLYFENPGYRGRGLYLQLAPIYTELFETGLVAVGFGVHAHLIRPMVKHFTLEQIVTAYLGRQTVDNYNQSPLIKEHAHRHISRQVLEDGIAKYVGEIEQYYPIKLFNHDYLTSKFHKANHYAYQDEENFEVLEFDCESQLPPPIDLYKARPQTKQYRLKKCHSIELLEWRDSFLKLKITSDALFNCRSFIRDLGLDLGCHAAIDTLHTIRVGPLHVDDALRKHQLHYDQIVQSAEKHSKSFEEYLAQLRQQYPEVKMKEKWKI